MEGLWLITWEESDEAMIRLVRFLCPRPGVSEDSFNAYRRDFLGPLVAGHQAVLQLVRYVQTHRGRGSTEAESAFLALRPGTDNRFAGLDEFWWRDQADCLRAVTPKDGTFQQVLRSGDGVIDFASSISWLAIEYPQVATSLARMVAAPRTGLLKLAFAICPSLSLNESNARRYWLVQHGPLIRSMAPARGTLAYIQVHRLHDEAACAAVADGFIPGSAFLGHAEAWFADSGTPRGGDGDAAVAAAIADEREFIDWSRSCVLVGKELVFVDRSWI
jgi:hypothetical protein